MSVDAETLRLLWAVAAGGGKATRKKIVDLIGGDADALLTKAVAAGWVEETVKGRSSVLMLAAAGVSQAASAPAALAMEALTPPAGGGSKKPPKPKEPSTPPAADALAALEARFDEKLAAVKAELLLLKGQGGPVGPSSLPGSADLTALKASLADVVEKTEKSKDKLKKLGKTVESLDAGLSSAEQKLAKLAKAPPPPELTERLADQERRIQDLTTTILHLSEQMAVRGGGSGAAVWPTDDAAQEAAVLAAVERVASNRRDKLAPLWELRAALAGAPRPAVDAAIHRLGVARRLDLIGTDNQQLLTNDQAQSLISNPHGAPTGYLALPGATDDDDEI